MSIRYKIFGAFSVVILLACGLAFYGIRGISTAGDQVVRLYDGPLMGINHARSAHAGLNEARLIMQRSLTVGATSEAVARFEKLVRNISEDLSVVRDRQDHSPSPKPERAAIDPIGERHHQEHGEPGMKPVLDRLVGG